MTADIFYQQLLESPNKVVVLARLFIHLFGEQRNIYKILAKLTKAYGERIVFFSILDCYDLDNFSASNPYGLLSYFAKKRLEASIIKNNSKDLTEFSKEIEKLFEWRAESNG